MNLFHKFFGWLVEERRLAVAEHWHDGVYHNRPTVQSIAQRNTFSPDCAQADRPPIEPFTRLDPACRKVEIRQRLARHALSQRGIREPRVPIGSAIAYDPRHYQFVRRSGD